jgi:hypothetical protein
MQRPNAAQRPPDTHTDEDLKAFLLVLRRALLMVTGWIERRYQIGSDAT